MLLWRRQPHHAARVKEYAPKRLVGWLQDELQRFHGQSGGESFTLHDFRRIAITGMQMAGVSEKETSVMVGATPEVIRRHYEKLDQLKIAKRVVQRRLAGSPAVLQMHLSLRAPCARGKNGVIDTPKELTQTVAG